ncbi:MAG: hypothetical protein M9921_03150 [Fimbriimonadaceae bacterium]|nr:hypothetical protein [Chthonomonadaceae bacterium]MCO5295831.1 hypothetical protein [Fimbriimonadaceae bacterium]
MCETLEWRGEDRLIVARGNVRVESPDWKMGPEGELWANADLTRVGTPEEFKGGKP